MPVLHKQKYVYAYGGFALSPSGCATCFSYSCCDAYALCCFLLAWSQQSIQRHGHTAFRLDHPASRWSKFLVGKDNFVPSRRFLEDGLEALRLSTGVGGGARVNTLGAPAVAKRTTLLSLL